MTRPSVTVGLAASLSAGFFEMILVTVLFAPPRLPALPAVLASLAATVVLFLFVYFALWFLVLSHVGRRLRLHAAAFCFSSAVFLGTIFTLLSLRLLSLTLAALDLFKISLLLAICLLAAVGSYFLAQSAAAVLARRRATVFLALTLPVILAAAMVLAWFCRHQVESFFATPSLLAAAGYVLAAVLTAAFLDRVRKRIRVARWLAAFAALVLASPIVAALAAAARPAPAPERQAGRALKNVILVTDDTLRWDFLSCYGARRVETPHVDRLAADGILFTKAYSAAPWTLPSLASIMTGLAPPVHQVTKRNPRLAEGARTLAEHMRDAGYYTAAFAQSWYLARELNLSQGFHEYNLQEARVYPTWGGRLLEQLYPGRFRAESSARSLTRSVARWLEANQGKDFFLWVHYVDPHMPYTPPADLLDEEDPPGVAGGFLAPGLVRSGYAVPTRQEREALKALYGAEVRLVDEGVGELLAVLDRLGLYDRSLIVFTSDHGEEFWEHGGFEHGHSLYDELIRVPLVVKPPRSAAPRRVEIPVSTPSVFPTILDMSGIEYVKDFLSAPSLRALWEAADGAMDERPIFSTSLVFYEDRESVVLDGFKYIRSLVGDREELYDLEKDPLEQVSVAALHPDKVQRARNVLEENRRRNLELARHHRFALGEEGSELDEQARRQWKALGYLK